jgi:hypothetical protein
MRRGAQAWGVLDKVIACPASKEMTPGRKFGASACFRGGKQFRHAGRAGALAGPPVIQHPRRMSAHSPDDTDRLKSYLGGGRFGYVDFQEAEMIQSAQQRWPLLSRLLQPAADDAKPSKR